MLSDIFDEPVDKKNLKSVLERQGNVNISFGEKSKINHSLIGCINISSTNPQNKSDQNNSLHPEVLNVKKSVIKIAQNILKFEQAISKY